MKNEPLPSGKDSRHDEERTCSITRRIRFHIVSATSEGMRKRTNNRRQQRSKYGGYVQRSDLAWSDIMKRPNFFHFWILRLFHDYWIPIFMQDKRRAMIHIVYMCVLYEMKYGERLLKDEHYEKWDKLAKERGYGATHN
jgi:hypothetical protein